LRKLTGLFIAAAVTGTVWWQLPNITGRSLTAQTGRSASSSSSAYDATARRLMQQAQSEARRGNGASAKRLALQASRFPVKWAANELSPTQLLSQLQGRRTPQPRQLNPASVAGRQPATQAQPKPSNELVTRAAGTTNSSSQPTISQTGFNDSKPRQSAAGSTGEASPLRKRVDQYMARARAAWQKGDRDGAVRQATVARLLADDVKFQPGEETPDAFLNRVQSAASNPANAVASGSADATGPAFLDSAPRVQPTPSTTPNPFAEPPTNPFAQPELATATQPTPERKQALQSAGDKKQYAGSLLNAAKEDLRANRLDSAYEKALLASQVDTAWNLFDETPEQVLANIRRLQQQSPRPTETLVQSGNRRQPTTSPNPFSAPSNLAEPTNKVIEIVDREEPTTATPPTTNISDEEFARQLVAESRQLMRDGRFDEARAAALKAKNLDTKFDLFADQPRMVLRDIDRLSGSLTLTDNNQTESRKPETLPEINPFQAPAGPTTSALAAQNEKRAKAQQLLSSARAMMRKSNFAGAKDLVNQARSLNAAYSLFDERPDVVMADIERLQKQFTPSTPPTEQRPANPFAEPAELISSNSAQPNSKGNEDSPFLPESSPLAEKTSAQTPAAQQPAASPFDEPTQLLSATDNAQPRVTQSVGSSALPNSNAARSKQAADLLGQARQLIKVGRLDEAQALAQQADELDVIYELFADRPEDVYAAIDRVSSPASQPQSRPIVQRSNQLPTSAQETARADAAPALPTASPFVAELSQPSAPTTRRAPSSQAVSTNRQKAQSLLKQARNDLSVGNFTEAMLKANQVNNMDLTFGAFDDRPELLIADIAETKALQQVNIATNSNIQQTGQTQLADTTSEPVAAPPSEYYPEAVASNAAQPATSPERPDFGNAQRLPGQPLNIAPAETFDSTASDFNPTVGSFAGNSDPYDNITTIHPSGVSAEALYNEGINNLRQGNRDGAYQAFLESWQSGQKLDPYKSQQLQDYLRELAPRRQQTIQLTGAESSGVPGSPSFNTTRPIDVAAQREQLKFDRLRTEVQNAVLRADTLKEKRPNESIEILDRMMAELENSGFENDQVAPMVRQLRRSRTSVDSYMTQRAPIIELQQRNEEVKNLVKAEQRAKVRIGQEFAAIVEEYNKFYKQRRYAEAQVKAKEAKELDPTNPVAVNMELKAMFARRNDSNNKLRDNKEASFWAQLDDVEQGAIVRVGDKNPMVFSEDWGEISKRRLDKYGNDMRSRTDEEKQIEESLSNKISLHFENTPLIEIIRYVRTATGTNVAIDALALEEEGVTTNTQVTIDVDNIMVQSALNLILEPLNLGYSIENEVLKITSKLRQQGKMVAAAYPVADLVVRMRSKNRDPSNIFTNNLFNADAQMSVPSVGGVQNSGMFQVGSGQSQSPFMMGGGSGMNAELSGSGQQQFEFDTLVDLLTSVVEPDSWMEVGGLGTIRSNETTLSLVIRQTQEVHREISDLLDQLRRLQDLQVTIEVRLVNVSDNFFERIGVDFDFDIQDSVGGPGFDGGATAGGQQGGGGQQGQQGGGPGVPLPAFGTVIGGGGQQQQGQQGQGGQQGQQGQQGATQSFFTPSPSREFTDRDSYPGDGTIIGLAAPGAFTSDLDIAFQQGSFDIGVPDFGNFQPNAGLQVGLAILSDIETFFFIQAAQGDERSNLLFAPKVTLFNGDTATIFDQTVRPFVLSLQPTVGAFSVGFTPQIGFIPDGITLTVTAVISADRRFVRLALSPFFNNLIDLQTFSFLGGQTGQGGQQGGGQQGGQQGGGGQGGGGLGGQVGGGGAGGVGGIGGGPRGPMGMGSALGRFGMPLHSMGQLPANGTFGMGGIGGGGGQQGGGQQGGGQQGQQGQNGANTTATVQQPIIATISVQTSVSVPDGGTVLLGGIKRLREGRNMAGVPILNKIPYISRLFKNSGVGRETSSIMLMVTPRIVIHEEEQQLLGIPLE
jgi:general secretion pathway protein D